MKIFTSRAAVRACALLASATAPHAAYADDGEQRDILVTATKPATIEQPPATKASVTARQIEDQVNAVNIEDTLKYLPSLVVRKRHIGDTQAPLATRTSGVGASARSLIYADGALLSALIGNNNTSASPRWGPGIAAGGCADRRSVRPVFRRLSRQFDRRGRRYHDTLARSLGG